MCIHTYIYIYTYIVCIIYFYLFLYLLVQGRVQPANKYVSDSTWLPQGSETSRLESCELTAPSETPSGPASAAATGASENWAI